MLSINNFQMTQQTSFKGKGDKVVKEVLEKAKNIKCNPVGNIQPKEKASVEHIIRKTPQQFSKEDKKILQLMEDMEISRIINDPRIPADEKKYILQKIMIQRAYDNGLLETLTEFAKAMLKKS